MARAVGGLRLPNLEALGLGHLTAIAGRARGRRRRAAPGGRCARPRPGRTPSPATGRWRGSSPTRRCRPSRTASRRRSPTPLRAAAGRGLLGNKTASGTVIIDELGPQHLATGDLILYTSADSVLQIAAHEEVVPLDELYRICEAARAIADRHRIGRVIARPFVGDAGRVSTHLQPARLSRWCRRRRRCSTDLVDGGPGGDRRRQDLGHLRRTRRSRRSLHSEGNADGLRLTLEALPHARARPAVRQPGRLRHALRPPQRRGRVRARARRARRLAAARSRRRCAPATSPSSPPTTATIRPRPAPTTRASGSRCSPSAPACAPRRSARARRSATSARRSPPALGIPPLARGTSFLDALAG